MLQGILVDLHLAVNVGHISVDICSLVAQDCFEDLKISLKLLKCKI